MGRAGIYLVIMICSCIFFPGSLSGAEGRDTVPFYGSSDPTFAISFEGDRIPVDVEPGNDIQSTTIGRIDCHPGSLAPGQTIYVTIFSDSGPWESRLEPSNMSFTRSTIMETFVLEVFVPAETPVGEERPIAVWGNWRIVPGVKEGGIGRKSVMFYVRPYSCVNATAVEDRKTTTIGKETEFTILVENRGNILDRYLLTVAYDGECDVMLDSANFSVPLGSTSSLTISLVQKSGAPAMKTFSIHIAGQYPGSQGKAMVTLYLESRYGPSMVFARPWGGLILLLVLLGAFVFAALAGTWIYRRRRAVRLLKGV